MNAQIGKSQDELAATGTAPIAVTQVFDGIDAPLDRGPLSYQRPDFLILDDIVRSLAWDPFVPSTTLELECNDGVVRAGGTVPDAGLVERIELLISNVLGVKTVELAVTADEAWQPIPDKT